MIAVVIPCRAGDIPTPALETLDRQALRPNAVIVIPDDGHGANWARNRGLELCAKFEFVLFSDADIRWEPDALLNLYRTLYEHPEAAYSFGTYLLDGVAWCHRPFDATILKKINIVSTMSLVRREQFCGFDEAISRFQDWDAWLTMLEQGKVGVHCGSLIFTTTKRDGITFNGGLTPAQAAEIVKGKHGLL